MNKVWLALLLLCGVLGCGPSKAELMGAVKKAKASVDEQKKNVEEARMAYVAAKRKAVKARIDALWDALPADDPEKKPGPREYAHYLTEDISDTKLRFVKNREKQFQTAGTREHQEIEKQVLSYKQEYDKQKEEAKRAAKALKKAEGALKK